MRGSLVRTVPPAISPVSLAEVKEFLKVEHSDEDALLEQLIDQAIGCLEGPLSPYTLAIITQSWVWRLDAFPYGYYLEVPLVPLQNVLAIQYEDGAGTQVTWDPALYRVDSYATPGRIQPAPGEAWPMARPALNAVTITFRAGYGDTPDDVPEAVRGAVRRVAGHFYDHRDSVQLPADVWASLDGTFRTAWAF